MSLSSEGRPPGAPKARVLIVDDHPLVRIGLAKLIDEEHDLCAHPGAADSSQAISIVRNTPIDVVLVDIALGAEDGLELIRQLRPLRPELPILALSLHEESLYAERALRAGANGYIMKCRAMDEVMSAIRRVLAGEVYISQQLASRMVQKLVAPRAAQSSSGLSQLTDREFEVFKLIAQSVGPTKIASRLGVSVKTVETHREHIKKKLGIKTGAELTRFCILWTAQSQLHSR